MSYVSALYIPSTKKYIFTKIVGRRAIALGYCISDGGHPNPEQASLCYRKYVIDNAKEVNISGKCRICNKDTNKGLEFSFLSLKSQIPLCETHFKKENLSTFIPNIIEGAFS